MQYNDYLSARSNMAVAWMRLYELMTFPVCTASRTSRGVIQYNTPVNGDVVRFMQNPSDPDFNRNSAILATRVGDIWSMDSETLIATCRSADAYVRLVTDGMSFMYPVIVEWLDLLWDLYRYRHQYVSRNGVYIQGIHPMWSINHPFDPLHTPNLQFSPPAIVPVTPPPESSELVSDNFRVEHPLMFLFVSIPCEPSAGYTYTQQRFLPMLITPEDRVMLHTLDESDQRWVHRDPLDPCVYLSLFVQRRISSRFRDFVYDNVDSMLRTLADESANEPIGLCGACDPQFDAIVDFIESLARLGDYLIMENDDMNRSALADYDDATTTD